MEPKKLKIGLYGAFWVAWPSGEDVPLKGSKLKAMIALLALDPRGVRTRSWLQDKLWGRVGTEHGRASLRQSLRTLRAVFGGQCEHFFDIGHDQIQLRPECFEIVGDEGDGQLLEGLDIDEPGFRNWLSERRASQQVSPTPGQKDVPADQRLLPSIAVLPFTGFGVQPGDDAVGDVLAAELTRAMARSSLIDVISHLSSRKIDSRTTDLQQLRQLLDVDYAIQGQFVPYARHLRLDIDLIDVDRGKIIWTSDFQVDLGDFLNGDKEAIWQIGQQVGQTIVYHSIDLASTEPLPDLESHRLLMSSIALMHELRLNLFARSRTQLEELLARIPNSSILNAWLAQWYNLSIQQGWSIDRAKDGRIALDHVNRALDANPHCSFSLAMDGLAKTFFTKNFVDAGESYDQALRINPNNSLAWLFKSVMETFKDEGETAVQSAARACRLSPLDPHRFLYDSLSASAAVAAGRYEDAVRFAEDSLKVNGRHNSTYRSLIPALVELGREDEARKYAARLMRIEPGFSVRNYEDYHPAAGFSVGKICARAFRKVGLS